MKIPTRTFNWPGTHQESTQISQLKVAGISPPAPSSTQQAKSPTTQGVPQPVTSVVLVKKPAAAGKVQLTVSFGRNTQDPYYVSADVYIKYGTAQPILVSGGAVSPVVLTLNKTVVPAVVIVTSRGNWGSTPQASSPSKAVSIA